MKALRIIITRVLLAIILLVGFSSNTTFAIVDAQILDSTPCIDQQALADSIDINVDYPNDQQVPIILHVKCTAAPSSFKFIVGDERLTDCYKLTYWLPPKA